MEEVGKPQVWVGSPASYPSGRRSQFTAGKTEAQASGHRGAPSSQCRGAWPRRSQQPGSGPCARRR